jgi:arylsulfatase
MITRMDREIGRVLAQLKAMNAYDNTLILFVSDNGASSEQLIRADGHDPNAPPGSGRSHLCLGPGWSSAANAPFRLHKSWVHEGGISSPWIAHWPNGIKEAGKLRHSPCHFVDLLPTLVELAGGKPQLPQGAAPLPGRSIAPGFQRDGAFTRNPIYFHHSNNRALRSGDWKVVAAGAQGPWELYDMRVDRSEQTNLAASQPGRVADMAAEWKRRDDEYVRQRESAKPMPKDRI